MSDSSTYLSRLKTPMWKIREKVFAKTNPTSIIQRDGNEDSERSNHLNN